MAKILNLIFFFVAGCSLEILNDNPKGKPSHCRWSYWLVVNSIIGIYITALLM